MQLLLNTATIVIVALIIRGLWQASRPHRYFTIRLINGEPKAVQGTVTPALLRLVAEIAAFNNVKKGRISGVASGQAIRLEFSRSIPQPARQQMRNGWGAMGWKGPKRQGRR